MKKFKWSRSRPVKPDVDPLVNDLREKLNADDRSTYQKANASGISTSAIRNIQISKTKRPQALTVTMLYRALGFDMIFRKRK